MLAGVLQPLADLEDPRWGPGALTSCCCSSSSHRAADCSRAGRSCVCLTCQLPPSALPPCRIGAAPLAPTWTPRSEPSLGRRSRCCAPTCSSGPPSRASRRAGRVQGGWRLVAWGLPPVSRRACTDPPRLLFTYCAGHERLPRGGGPHVHRGARPADRTHRLVHRRAAQAAQGALVGHAAVPAAPCCAPCSMLRGAGRRCQPSSPRLPAARSPLPLRRTAAPRRWRCSACAA